MEEQFVRTAMLLGEAGVEKLQASHVAVFGVGGVGGFAVEALARAGVGVLTIVDNDTVAMSNLNRQIIATVDTVGKDKVSVMAKRILSINPGAIVIQHKTFFLPQTAGEFDFSEYDYVIDAIDTVSGKIALIEAAKAANVPIVSCMGAGNKLDPTAFRVADLYETTGCPLAKVMRRECRKRGIEKVKVVFSTEEAMSPMTVPAAKDGPLEEPEAAVKPVMRRATPGSLSFVPGVCGLIAAGEVIRDLVK